MCIFVKETKRKKVIGWKVCLKDSDGKYYSLYTGYDIINGEYRKEKVERTNKEIKYYYPSFEKNINARVSTFMKLNYAKLFKNSARIVKSTNRKIAEPVILKVMLFDEIAIVKSGYIRKGYIPGELLCDYYDKYNIDNIEDMYIGRNLKIISELKQGK